MPAKAKEPPAIDVDAFFSTQRPSRRERRALGKAVRADLPLADHAALPPTADRDDPVALLRSQEAAREPDLIPLRYQRMTADPFAFLRGSAIVMASDLSKVPNSGIHVQLCGDAHLANFGMFASAERALVFDVNDFDETLPGPFEWDVKRLAASFAVAARANGLKDRYAAQAAREAVRSYRVTMAALADQPTLQVWFSTLDVDLLIDRLRTSALRKATVKASAKARRTTGDSATVKLATQVDGHWRFRSAPPLVVPVPEEERAEVIATLAPVYAAYVATLPPDRVALLAKYSFVDLARKVVGVGSVGTRALVMLLESGDGEPLLLQIKQAGPSVLEAYLSPSTFDNSGKRVVVGQKVLQSTGDPFLGWTRGSRRAPFDFYIRQLHDMKGSIDSTLLDRDALMAYARVCGAVLARAHARAGDASTVSGYLGDSGKFDDAVAAFALAYADITVADHAALVASDVPR